MYPTQNEHRKEAFAITSALFVLLGLLLFLFTFDFTSKVLELEGGGGGGDIAVNFGDSDVGQGNNIAGLEHVEAPSKAKAPEPKVQEALVTNASDNPDAVAVTKTEKPKEQPKKPIEKPVEPVKPKPSSAAASALANMSGSSTSKEGDGNDGRSGNKGKAYGDPNATGYNGGGGSGTGSGGGNGSGQGLGTGSGYGNGNGGGRGNGTGNYQLAGRKVLTKPQPRYTCNEEGVVVVEISVNTSGSVIAATAGVRGTTNAASCLLEQAKQAALKTRFDASDSAPEKQLGKIIYNFKLTQ